MKLYLQLQKVKDLTPSERQVVDYILEHYESMESLGIVELAKRSYTSPTTIKRLCSKVGIDSYIEFRYQLAKDGKTYQEQRMVHQRVTPVKQNDSTQTIINKVTHASAKAILESKDLNDASTFETVVSLMQAAKQLDFYGIGPSHIVAKDAAIKALRLGIAASSYDNHIEMMINAKVSTKERLAILISYTGENQDIVHVAKELLVRGVPTISLTLYSNNTLASLCATNLYVHVCESSNRLGAMSSRLCFLYVIDICFTCLLHADYEHFNEVLLQSFLATHSLYSSEF